MIALLATCLLAVSAPEPPAGAAILTRSEEGLRLAAYPDPVTGRALVGYGHELLPGESRTITLAQADALLLADLAKATTSAMKWLPGPHPPEVQTVLTCMVYQLGEGKVQTFKRFAAAIRRKDYPAAAAEMLDSAWARQTPARVRRLTALLPQ